MLTACEPVASTSDAGGPKPELHDAGPSAIMVEDGGFPDAGDPDAGESDAGEPDAGSPDAGGSRFANGVWLTRNYVAYSSFYDPAVVDDLAQRMRSQYQVSNWFVNADRVGADGRLINPPPRFNEFLNNLASWEARNNARFRVFAWVSGSTTGTTAMDLTRPEVRQAVVAECQKLVAPSVPGSYVAQTTRPFDGVQIDFEPSGLDQVRFNALLSLMEELRAGLAAVGRSDALLSVAAHKLGTGNQWFWSPEFYYAMASRVDVLASMTYNSGSTTGAAYQAWIRAQTSAVLKAVSGQAWTSNHPPPTRPVEVLFGLPAYPSNASHEPTAENIAFGAQGLREGMADLESAGDPSLSYLGGAAVYLHTKGTANDGYARWDTEWWWFGHYWLQRW